MVIVLYHHRFGTDAWLAKDHEMATLSCVATVIEWIETEDVREPVRERILHLLESREFTKGLRAWSDATGEHFETIDADKPLQAEAANYANGLVRAAQLLRMEGSQNDEQRT